MFRLFCFANSAIAVKSYIDRAKFEAVFPQKQMAAFRFDDTSILTRTEEREDGVYAFSTVARDGLLTYFTAEGKKVNELRPASANRSATFLDSLKGLPATIEHPRALLTTRESPIGELAEKGSYLDSEGEVNCVLRLKDRDVAANAKKGEKSGLSLGYKANIIETPSGVWYDSIDNITYKGDFVRVQTDIDPNHIALTDSPRGGKGVKIHFDSADMSGDEYVGVERSDSICTKEVGVSIVHKEGKTMTTKTVRIDNVEWEIESGAAAVFAQKLARLDALEASTAELAEQLKLAEAELEEKDKQLEAAVGRSDGYEEAIDLISDELNQLREDAKKMAEEDEDPEEEAGETQDEEDAEDKGMPKSKKKKGFIPFKKGEKMDSAAIADVLQRPEVQEFIGEFLEDEIDSRLDSFARASELLESRGITLEDAGITTRMDGMTTIRTAIATINKDSDLSEKTDDYVVARFDAYYETIGQNTAPASSHTRNFAAVVNTVKNDSKETGRKGGQARTDSGCSENYKKPLALSKRK